jgi:hypothetical protein
MSITFDLVCGTCPARLCLGKIVYDQAADLRRFSGWYVHETAERIEGARMLRYVEQFLLLHWEHDLAVLHEHDVSRLLDELDRDIDDMIDEPDFLARPPVWPESAETPAAALEFIARCVLRHRPADTAVTDPVPGTGQEPVQDGQ